MFVYVAPTGLLTPPAPLSAVGFPASVVVGAVLALASSWRICLRFLFLRAGGFQWVVLKGFGRGEMSRGSRMGLGTGC